MKKHLQKFLFFYYIFFTTIVCEGQNLDTTFNTTGIFTTAIGTSDDEGRSILIDHSGKIVVGGNSQVGTTPNFSAIRLNTDGTLDNSFDSDGKFLNAITAGGGIGINIGLLSNHNFIFSGYAYNPSDLDYALINLLSSDGSFDASYASNGESIVTVSLNSDEVNEMAVQSDDKIVLVGDSAGVPSIVRLTANGALDNSFGGNGIVAVMDYTLNSVTVQSDGVIVVAGVNHGDFIIIRLLSDGTPDNSFGENGITIVDMGSNDIAYSVRIQKDGKIIVGGSNGNDFLICRLKADGSIDTSFDNDGRQSVDLGTTDICYSIAEDTITHKIIAGGYSFDGARSIFGVARLSDIGSLEAKATIAVGSADSEARSIAIQSDSKIVLAGNSYNGIDDDFAVVRLLPDFVTNVTTDVLTAEIILQNINLFPNPAYQTITIHSVYDIEQIKVMDVLGNEVLNITSAGNRQIDISSLPKGLYNFIITTSQGIDSKKVSVQ